MSDLVRNRQDTYIGVTRELSRFVHELRHDALSPELRASVKARALDTISCSVAGSVLEPGKIVLRLFERLQGAGQSRVWATGKSVPCVHAAYTNAFLANLMDYDDTYSGAGHPGATVVSAAAAVGEMARASGQELLTALVAGYEVTVRIGLAIAPSEKRYKRAWGYGHQILGAAAAASKLLSLDVEATAVALHLAGVSAPVPYIRKLGLEKTNRPFSWLKNNYGWMAMGGVLAALLAEAGFRAPGNVLDGETGFWVMAGSDRCDFDGLLAGLGEEMLSAEIEHKPYASCRWTHTAIEAAEKIRADHGVRPQQIDCIIVETFSEQVYNFDVVSPQDIIDAQFSLPYLVALALCGRSPSRGLSEIDLKDEEVLGVARKVQMRVDPSAERQFFEGRKRPAAVTVRMKDGQQYSRAVAVPLGHPSRKLGWEEIAQKSRLLVSPILGSSAANNLIEACHCLDGLDQVGTLTQSLHDLKITHHLPNADK